jgi:hypothetical protein
MFACFVVWLSTTLRRIDELALRNRGRRHPILLIAKSVTATLTLCKSSSSFFSSTASSGFTSAAASCSGFFSSASPSTTFTSSFASSETCLLISQTQHYHRQPIIPPGQYQIPTLLTTQLTRFISQNISSKWMVAQKFVKTWTIHLLDNGRINLWPPIASPRTVSLQGFVSAISKAASGPEEVSKCTDKSIKRECAKLTSTFCSSCGGCGWRWTGLGTATLVRFGDGAGGNSSGA